MAQGGIRRTIARVGDGRAFGRGASSALGAGIGLVLAAGIASAATPQPNAQANLQATLHAPAAAYTTGLTQDAPAPAAGRSSVSDRATFLISNERLHDDPVVGWEGFLAGLRGFEHFYNPIGNPLYFETPLNNTGVRFLYLHHTFADGSQLRGGHVNVYAMQARVALTERLAFIATKDGFSALNAGLLPADEGSNSIAAGLKYAFYVDREADLVVTAGFRYMFDTGDDGVLQSGVQELSPFISAAKGFDRFRLMANLTDRIPLDNDDGNNVLHWDLSASYEVAPDGLPGFAPIVELRGLHYLSDGERFPLSVGGLDYTNLGSNDVSGSTVISLGGGIRWKLSPHASLGAMYEHALTNVNADIMESRITVDLAFDW